VRRLLLSALATAIAPPVFAAVVHVPADEPTIQAGINAAVAGDTVLVACGTYDEYEIKMKSGVHLLGDGGPCPSDPCVTIEPQVSAAPGKDGIVCNGVDDTATIQALRISGRLQPAGSVSSGIRCTDSDVAILCCRVEYWKGSGIHLTDSSPLVKTTTCQGNGTNALQGGGLYSLNGSPKLQWFASVLDHAGDGGGVWSGGAPAAILEFCLFMGSTASGEGGSVYCESGTSLFGCTFGLIFGAGAARGANVACTGAVSIDSCRFVAGSAEHGGGIYVVGGSPSISRTTIENTYASASGGGIYLKTGNATVAGCSILNNRAAGAGGGIYVESGSLTLSDCTLLENETSSGDGAGIAAEGGTLDLSDVLIARGDCSGTGSGAWLSNATASVLRCTITQNRAGGTGGLHAVGSTLDVQESIVAESCYGVPEVTSESGAVVNLSCCDIDAGRVVTSSGTVNWVTGNFFAAPGFCGAVRCNDTNRVSDYSLASNSPCLPANNGCGVLIGARGQACSIVSIEQRSWGSIKAGYR